MLKPHHFSFQCTLKLSDLSHSDQGYFCDRCRRQIHDLTDCSLDEVRELKKRQGSICGFIRLASLSSVVALSACTKDGSADATPPEVIQQPTETPVLLGEICVPEDPKPAGTPSK